MEHINNTDVNKAFEAMSFPEKHVNSNTSKSCLLESEESLGILPDLINDTEYFNETDAVLNHNLEKFDVIFNSSNVDGTLPRSSNPNSSFYSDNLNENDFEFLCTSTPKAVLKSNMPRKSTEFRFSEIDNLMNDMASVPIVHQFVPKFFSDYKHQTGVKESDTSSDILNKTRTEFDFSTLTSSNTPKSFENNVDSNICTKAIGDVHMEPKVLNTTYDRQANRVHCDAHISDTSNFVNSDSLVNSTKVSTDDSSTEKTFVVNVSISKETNSSLKCSVEESKCSVEESKCSVEESKCSVEESKCSVEESKCSVEESKCSVKESECSVEERCNINKTFSKSVIQNCTTMKTECNQIAIKDYIRKDLQQTVKINSNDTFCIDKNKKTVTKKGMTLKHKSSEIKNKLSTHFNNESKPKREVQYRVNKCKETVSSKDVCSKASGSDKKKFEIHDDKNTHTFSKRLNPKAVCNKIKPPVLKTTSSKCTDQQIDAKEEQNCVIANNPARRSLKMPKRLEVCDNGDEDTKGRRNSISSTHHLKSTTSNTRASHSFQTVSAKMSVEKRPFALNNKNPKVRKEYTTDKGISPTITAPSKTTTTTVSSSCSRQSVKRPESKEIKHSVVVKTSLNQDCNHLNPKASARLPHKGEGLLRDKGNQHLNLNAATNIGRKDHSGSVKNCLNTTYKTQEADASSSSRTKVLTKRPQGSLKKPASYFKN